MWSAHWITSLVGLAIVILPSLLPLEQAQTAGLPAASTPGRPKVVLPEASTPGCPEIVTPVPAASTPGRPEVVVPAASTPGHPEVVVPVPAAAAAVAAAIAAHQGTLAASPAPFPPPHTTTTALSTAATERVSSAAGAAALMSAAASAELGGNGEVRQGSDARDEVPGRQQPQALVGESARQLAAVASAADVPLTLRELLFRAEDPAGSSTPGRLTAAGGAADGGRFSCDLGSAQLPLQAREDRVGD